MAARKGKPSSRPRKAKKTPVGSKAPRKKTGRPLIPIDWEKFDVMCAVQCTLAEIAGFFECSEDTIERAVLREKKMRFADYFEQKRSDGKVSLRRRQYQAAMAGDRTMLVWLGKQWLNQTDKFESRSDISVQRAPDLSALSIEELLQLRRLREKIDAGTGDPAAD